MMPSRPLEPLFWLLGVTLLLVAAGMLFQWARRERRPCEQTCAAPAGLAALLTIAALLVSLDQGLVWGVVQVLVCVMVATAQMADDRMRGRWEAAQTEVNRRSPLQTDARPSASWLDRPARRI